MLHIQEIKLAETILTAILPCSNGGPTGKPTDGVPITDVTLDDITGDVIDGAQPYYILCAACEDWVSGSPRCSQ